MPRTSVIPIELLDPARVRPVQVLNRAKRGMTAGFQATQAIRYVAACQPGIMGLLLASRKCAHGSTPRLQRTVVITDQLANKQSKGNRLVARPNLPCP